MPARLSDLLPFKATNRGLTPIVPLLWLAICMVALTGCASPNTPKEIVQMDKSTERQPYSNIVTKSTAETFIRQTTTEQKVDSTTQPKNNIKKTENGDLHINEKQFIDLTPYTIYEDRWGTSQNSEGEHIKKLGGEFSDCYTRLLITSKVRSDGRINLDNGQENATDPDTNEIDEYSYKPRWWITRALFGKEFSLNFSTKVIVGSLEETIPLVTIGHESNSGGEKWSRVLRHADHGHPLFLVKGSGNGAIPKITVTMHGSQSYASRGAASALQVVFAAVNAISPTLPLATTLSAQSSKDRANSLDTAISKLFGTDVKEEHTTTHDFRFWSAENGLPNGINVTLSIPYPNESWGSDDKSKTSKINKKQVGTWTITFDYPRPSIFSNWRICKKKDPDVRCMETKEMAQQKVLAEIDAAEVLSYDLLNDGKNLATIRAYLAQQEWFAQAQTKLVAANIKQAKTNNTVKNTANQMCRSIRNSITGLNLNGFDADIVVWAVLKGMPWPDNSPTYNEMNKAEDCSSVIKSIATARNQIKP
ncbi:MAG: hypothetical protein Q7T38_01630 [Gallionella sp.]|nr:hypothetical protein [Gallionella sp.]